MISDGVLHGRIVDVIAEPERQGQGSGRSIMQRLLARCREAGIRDVQLFCAKGKADFYRQLGFRDRPIEVREARVEEVRPMCRSQTARNASLEGATPASRRKGGAPCTIRTCDLQNRSSRRRVL